MAESGTVHPLVRELFALLPEPGAAFPLEQRGTWLAAALACFDLLYGRPSESTAQPERRRLDG